MKTKDQVMDLILEGFSIQTLGNLNEKQINALHKRIVKEQTTVSKKPPVNQYTVSGGNFATTGPATIKKDPTAANKYTVVTQGNVTANEQEMTERKKSSKKNPWAICTDSLSDEFGTSERSEWSKDQMKKYERCVMGVKKSMKEGKNPYEPIIESKIMDIVKKHISPRMTKKDFLNTLLESPETAPVKPKTKPTTKPSKPSTPFAPKPGPNPGPKAKSKIPSWFTFNKLGIKLKK